MDIITNLSPMPLPSNGEELNPFHHDMDRMGVRINDRFIGMYHPIHPNKVVLVDLATGQRIEIQGKEIDCPCPGCKAHEQLPIDACSGCAG
jgi:hypothetical protein